MALYNNSPVIIGGLGGSGTRVVAQILIDLGFFCGDDLNGANDNLVFTRLFKSPRWLAAAGSKQVEKRLEIFEKYMHGQALTAGEFFEYTKAALKNETFSTGIRQLFNINRGKEQRRHDGRWGFKEPNSHIFLKYLVDYFPGMKYMHVIRNGADMSFSKNVNQLRNWGRDFGVDADEGDLAYQQMEYWVRANKAVIEKGRQLLGDNFTVVHFDNLCLDPAPNVDKILEFLGISADPALRQLLLSRPAVPSSLGRYKNEDISIFSAEQLKELKALGFSVEA